MNELQIGLLGKFDVRRNDEPVAGLEGRKVQDLLAFLLLQRSRPHSREYLAELLWGQRAPAQSKKYLRQTLWQVHSALAALGGDVAVFEAAYEQAQGIAGKDLDDGHADRLRQAVEVYRGDLLPGCYEDWCIFERERLQNMYLAMLDKLIDCCQRHGQFERGLAYGGTILRLDRARERTHRRMMRLYYLAGDRTSALRQFDQLKRALREELDVSPSQSSLVLRDQIRADSLEGMLPPSGGVFADPHQPQGGATALDARLHLRHLHACLTRMRRQITQEIESIEQALAEA